MSFNLPGLGLEDSPIPSHAALHHPSIASNQTTVTTTHNLFKQTEYRLEIPATTTLNLKLLTGTAEIFGTELVIANSYTFPGPNSFAVYTWHGCTFEITAPEDFQGGYIAEETPMNEYINTHFALDQLRHPTGPRVMILGPQDSGKTTLAKFLTAQAIRSAGTPLVVNLDPKEGLLSIPGTLTASLFKSPLDVEEAWGCAPLSGPSGVIPVKLPIVYYYGSDTVADTPASSRSTQLYRSLTARLALTVTGRLQNDAGARATGAIIDTPGSLAQPANTNLIAHLISEFGVTHIITLGSERLYADVVKRFDGTPVAAASSSNHLVSSDKDSRLPSTTTTVISVIRLPKSGGAIDRDAAFLRAHRTQQVRRYFYGDDRLASQGQVKLSPRVLGVDWSALAVWQLVGFEGDALSSSNNSAGGGEGFPGFGADDDDDDDFAPGDAEESGFFNTSRRRQGYNNTSSSSVPVPATQLFARLASPLPSYAGHVLAVLNCGPDPSSQDEVRDSSVMGFLLVQGVEAAGAGAGVSGRVKLLSPLAGRVPERAVVLGDLRGPGGGYVEMLR